MRFLLFAAWGFLLIGCSTTPPKETSSHFQSQPLSDGSKFIFDCQSSRSQFEVCKLTLAVGKHAPLKENAFTFVPMNIKHQYLWRLIADSANSVLQYPKKTREVRIDEKDFSSLANIASNQESCFMDNQYQGLMIVCAPVEKTVVVVFFRGICDRCEFQPVILRKLN